MPQLQVIPLRWFVTLASALFRVKHYHFNESEDGCTPRGMTTARVSHYWSFVRQLRISVQNSYPYQFKPYHLFQRKQGHCSGGAALTSREAHCKAGHLLEVPAPIVSIRQKKHYI